MNVLEKLFHLKENNAKVSTEILGGLLSFMAMSYILVVNPDILSGSGMGWGAVFIATILSSIFGTLLLGLVVNIPLAQSAAMGTNAFFTTTVCIILGFTWQEGLVIVFISAIVGTILTLTNVRKQLIAGIPAFIRSAISCGVGGFLALVGLINIGLITYNNNVPALGNLTDISIILFFVGLILLVILEIKKVPASLFIGLIVVTLLGIPFGITDINSSISVTDAFSQFPETFGAIFTQDGFPSLFSDLSRLPLAVIIILTFAMLDILNSIGTFIGAGKKVGLMTGAEIEKMASSHKLFATKTERALICDVSASAFGAVCGTTTVTTFGESIASVESGAKTGLAACVTALCFALCLFISPLASVIPACATAPILVFIGVKMMAPFAEIAWNKFEEALPAFFTAVFMVMVYNIADGIAAGLSVYCLIKICKKEFKSICPIILVFVILYFISVVFRIMVQY